MKSKDEVRDALLGILREMDKDPEYKEGADIFEDFGLDSLDQIEFLFNIEQAFGTKIEDETFEDEGLRQFDRLVDHLHDAQS